LRIRIFGRAVVVAMAAILVGVVSAFTAEAADGRTNLCSRSDYGCVAGTGYSGQQNWGYPGPHNCTLYAAYRLSQNGYGSPSGLGNAYEWDERARSRGVVVDSSPAVGAVAQGDAGAGHVMYVEEVHADHIIVTEDNWGGGTGQARIDRNSAYWNTLEFLHFRDISTPSSDRIGVIDDNNNLYVKEGVGGAWVLEASNVASFKLSPHRIAVVGADGNLAVKEGSLHAPWVIVGGAGVDYAISDTLIAVQVGSDLIAKVGALNATWQTILNPIQSFKISAGNHIAARMVDGSIVAQWGPVGAGWVTVTSGGDQYEITDNRLAVLSGGLLAIKEGSVGAMWTTVGGGSSFHMSPNRVAIVDGSGTLLVKEGPLNAMWTAVSANPLAFSVTDSMVGHVDGARTLTIKSGGLGAQWTTVAGAVVTFDIA